MKNDITYHWGDDFLLINLGSRIEPRIKALFCGEFVFTVGMATIFLLQSFPLKNHMVHWVSATGAALLYLLASYRFMTRMLSKEKILMDKNGITLITKTPLVQRNSFYEWDSIGLLRYSGKRQKSDHPLKGKCFDYFGFETHEHLIQSLHHEGNMSFSYCGFAVYFARGVYSWHAEEMVHIMKLYAGPLLRLGPEWEYMLQEHEMDEGY